MARAALVAAAWALSLLPVGLGWQRCALATICHLPCPGCGMTRAIKLLAAGRTGASLRLHPLAVPVLFAGVLLVVSTVWATLSTGSPMRLHRSRFGQGAIAAAIVVYVAALALWALRFFGYFGGPVPV
jgi:Kef-type K+ transport system membrane component KefB